jgi:hypothetical protein
VTPIAPADPRIYDVLAEAGFAGEPFNPRQHESCELMERYVTATAVRLLDDLELTGPLRAGAGADALLATRGFVEGFRPALRWLLARLARAGVLATDGERFAPAADPPVFDRDEIRAAVLAGDPSYAPAIALVDEAGAIYPRVARGETSGEHALFRKLTLWTTYFHNDNRYYALNNRVAARAAAARVGPATHVLEIGAGLGSATAALLELLAERGDPGGLASYRFTEPVVFFRRRAQRELEARHATLLWTFDALDLNLPWADQGVTPASVGLVWGVASSTSRATSAPFSPRRGAHSRPADGSSSARASVRPPTSPRAPSSRSCCSRASPASSWIPSGVRRRASSRPSIGSALSSPPVSPTSGSCPTSSGCARSIPASTRPRSAAAASERQSIVRPPSTWTVVPVM